MNLGDPFNSALGVHEPPISHLWNWHLRKMLVSMRCSLQGATGNTTTFDNWTDRYQIDDSLLYIQQYFMIRNKTCNHFHSLLFGTWGPENSDIQFTKSSGDSGLVRSLSVKWLYNYGMICKNLPSCSSQLGTRNIGLETFRVHLIHPCFALIHIHQAAISVFILIWKLFLAKLLSSFAGES